MALGTKGGAVPYRTGKRTESARTEEKYSQYMEHIMERNVIIINNQKNNWEQPWFSCDIDFREKM